MRGSIAEDDVDAIVRSERRVYESADRICTFSELAACSFVEDFGQSSTKVKAIFAGANVDTTRFSEGRDSVRLGGKSVLFVGRDYRRKGIDTLFEAWPMVRKRHPDALLHVVGGYPEGVPAEGVKVHGFVPLGSEEGERRLGRLYSEATLFCLPTRYEPFGVAFVEAMLAGLPCVGPASWAVPEIIVDGKTGWLFRDGSAKDLARVLSEAMDDPAHAQRLGLKARERASALCTWEKVAARALADWERRVGGGVGERTRVGWGGEGRLGGSGGWGWRSAECGIELSVVNGVVSGEQQGSTCRLRIADCGIELSVVNRVFSGDPQGSTFQLRIADCTENNTIGPGRRFTP